MMPEIISLKNLIDNNVLIDFPNDEITILFDLEGNSALFKNKIFTCEKLIFEYINNLEYNFNFYDCTFNCKVEFNNCNFDELSFKNTKAIKSLIVKGKDEDNKAKINSFRFYNEENFHNAENPKPQLTTDFYFSDLIISDVFSIENIDHIAGIFQFKHNDLGKKGNQEIRFKNTNFSNANFICNTFKSKTNFINTSFKYDLKHLKPARTRFEHTKFYNNTFKKVDFSDSTFDKLVEFDKCDFLSTTWFEKCKKLTKSKLRFVACEFKGYVLFDNSKINSFEIAHSFFEKKVSFDSFETNKMKLHQVSFEKVAYFDDLNKSNEKVIEDWDRKTLRAIKRELTNSHNQIDYLRFKAYELNAYKKEKGKKGKDNFILFLNENSNYFGLDWTKGICFIFKTSFIFYLFYLITFIIGIKDSSCLPQTFEEFLVIYIKFLNPVSFLKTPIEEAEGYFFPLLILNISKIFVSYGIYQTIQAFRKFGVNGG